MPHRLLAWLVQLRQCFQGCAAIALRLHRQPTITFGGVKILAHIEGIASGKFRERLSSVIACAASIRLAIERSPPSALPPAERTSSAHSKAASRKSTPTTLFEGRPGEAEPATRTSR